MPPIPRRDETIQPPDDASASASPFVQRGEYAADMAEIRGRLQTVETAMGELPTISGVVARVESATNVQTAELALMRTENANQTTAIAAVKKEQRRARTRLARVEQTVTDGLSGALAKIAEIQAAMSTKQQGTIVAIAATIAAILGALQAFR